MDLKQRLWAVIMGGVILCCSWNAGMARAQDPEPKKIEEAVSKALPLLQVSAAGHTDNRTCFSCHHQALPVLTFSLAAKRGFALDQTMFKRQLTHTHLVMSDWAKCNPNFKNFVGGGVDTAGHALLTLELGGWKKDEITTAVVEFLLLREKTTGFWRPQGNRPPSEASPFTSTALAVRALRTFGTPEQKQRIDERVDAARAWLLKTPAKDTEDRVYRLWGLKYADADPKEIQAAVRELRETQRDDGGWAQTDKLTSDAYATGSALVTLHQVGKMSIFDKAYLRGLDFLIKDQKPDGSWYVRSRSVPFQTYFETGFPYGKDQWISCAATSWAAAALVLGCSL